MITDDTVRAADEAFGVDSVLKKRVLVSKLNKKQRLVYEAIQEAPEAADNDALLLTKVWLKEGWSDGKTLFQNLICVSRPETLSRRRRELYNMGLITYSPTALKEREVAFKDERDKASPIPPQIRGRELEYGWYVNEGNGVGLSAPRVQISLIDREDD